MNNYQFCVQWILSQQQEKNIKVLDYGCGVGKIVESLRKSKVNAFGCDVFYEGANRLSQVSRQFLESTIIRKMDNNTIPFEDASFDFVINNQVIEHVENIDIVLTEIQRVLKSGGKVLNLFPDMGVWREGHCGIPFLHWFPKGSRFRVFYAVLLRMIGFGKHKDGKSILQWGIDFCDYLDKWTHYRTRKEIVFHYSKYFCNITHIEDYWLQQRLGIRKKRIVSWLPKQMQRFLVWKFAGLIFVTSKSI